LRRPAWDPGIRQRFQRHERRHRGASAGEGARQQGDEREKLQMGLLESAMGGDWPGVLMRSEALVRGSLTTGGGTCT